MESRWSGEFILLNKGVEELGTWMAKIHPAARALTPGPKPSDLILLHPRQQMSDDSPQSGPNLDILIVPPQAHH
jgi:hypothetical protein